MQYDGVVPQPGRNALGERSETSLANSVTDFTNSRGFRYGCLGLDTSHSRKSRTATAFDGELPRVTEGQRPVSQNDDRC
jgi:hypothetical protein